MWIRPPWTAESVEADFELSWDMIEHYFDRVARDAAWLGFVAPFIAELRRNRWGAKLRAGQSVATLILSRARQHGLRAGQSYVALTPLSNRTFAAEVSLRAEVVRREGVPPSTAGWLHEQLDELGAIPVD